MKDTKAAETALSDGLNLKKGRWMRFWANSSSVRQRAVLDECRAAIILNSDKDGFSVRGKESDANEGDLTWLQSAIVRCLT